MTRKAGLVSTNGTRIALESVHIEGQVDGLTAEMTILQRYCNKSADKLEIVYTFPLAAQAVLLGMDVTLGGRRLHGSIAVKEEAWERYEDAVADGDAPVLVELSSPGLYTASLGNINAGEEVIVELRYAQLLRFDDGSLRLTVPAVIAGRYGDEHGTGGLSLYQSVVSSILTRYPLTLRILLRDRLALAAIRCPSHTCGYEKTPDGLVVSVNSGAIADRDFILCLDGLERYSCALVGQDGDTFLMLAGFCPDLSGGIPQPLYLKILVDCSCSMAGDSIEQVRQALPGLPGLLERGDYVSYSRFGSTVRHETDGFLAHSPDTGVQLCNTFRHAEADMGGTEMSRALFSVLDTIAMPEAARTSPCVLLITDGAVWSVDEVIRASRASGQRIFAIGVGSAPAESLLHTLALQTGGAYELVSPNENILRSIRNMIGKMRQPAYELPYVAWGDEPVWRTPLPLRLYGGETAYVFASFGRLPTGAPTLRWRTGHEEHALVAENPRIARSQALVSLAGAARLAAAGTPEEARGLALHYRLVCEHTSLFLVHAQEDGKRGELPVLHQVPQMIAAGHGGFGTAVSPAAQKSKREGLGAGPASCAFLSGSGRSKDLKKECQPPVPNDPCIRIAPLGGQEPYAAGHAVFSLLSASARNGACKKDCLPPASGVPAIKVISVGDGGLYAVNHMVASGLKEVTFIAANTNAQILDFARADHTVLLDSEFFEGRGGPGQRLTEASLASVKEAVDGAHLVCIVAGMGGRTGTGASPAIADVAGENGALTVGIVTGPMRCEGQRRQETAEEGLAELRRAVDFLIVIPIDRLRQAAPEMSMREVFGTADAAMLMALRCISDALTRRGHVNIDFADVVRLLKGESLAGMGVGAACGENRAGEAARQALAHPLLADAAVADVRGALVTITAGPDLSREEVEYVTGVFMNAFHENATILISAASDETLEDEVRVAVIATGAI